ncbi:pectate lyase [Sphingobacterium athyrii]|uniref:Pectate lyase n=1 Tax=Sphingobacterium athyrii TaxID=2152717 RepID=A0A363NRE0_9SPHI|nr:pectate lyase [Sphingobacterium athyrii]PUV23280.1 pectate lyase [Sphingobacterium athyrii]
MRKIAILSFIAVSVFHHHCAGQSLTSTDSLAEKMLIYQLPNGAWPKQLVDKSVVDYKLPITKEILQKIKNTAIDHATLDNNATTREINVLIKAFKDTKNPAYLTAAEKGIAYILSAQYENGGFPQYYPNKSLYRAEITYNDNAMINALLVLYKVANKQQGFESVNPIFVSKAQTAVETGIACILKTQVMQDGIRSIWAAQYDQNTLVPAQARKFEPASLSTSESVAIVRFLMMQPATPAIQQAIESAIQWFQQNDIEGYRFDRLQDKLTGEYERKLVADSSSTIWARFYDLADNRPLFGDRDDTVKYNFEDVSEERRNGYAWFGSWPEKLIEKDFPKWKKQHKIQ